MQHCIVSGDLCGMDCVLPVSPLILGMRTIYCVAFAVAAASGPPIDRPSVRSLRQLFERSTSEPQTAQDEAVSEDPRDLSRKEQSPSTEEIVKNRRRFEITTTTLQPDHPKPVVTTRRNYREFNRWRGY